MKPAQRLCILLGLLLCSSTWAATVTVTTIDDNVSANDAKVTLREAITAINAGNDLGDADITAQMPGVFGSNDTIEFNIPGAGVHTITYSISLVTVPALTKTVFIDGYSQPGAAPNSNPLNAGINADLLIELHSNTGPALALDAPNCVIRGLVLHSASATATLDINASGAVVAGNFIGMDPTGLIAILGNSNYSIGLSSAADNALIGGSAPADRNLISGTRSGLHMAFPAAPGGVVVQGNYIGPDRTGADNDQFITTGGTGITDFSNARIIDNLISSNSGGGMRLKDANTVQGNLIGVQRDGVTPLRNESAGDVWIEGNGSLIGGTGVGEANVIGFADNPVGVVPGATGNTISGNSLLGNGKSISLQADSLPTFPLANDLGDADTAPGNLGQNYPVITSLILGVGTVTIAGTLNSTAASTFQIELFASATRQYPGHGPAETYLGTTSVTTDTSGNASFGPLTFAVPAGKVVFTGTATDASGNTSELAYSTKPTTTTLTSSLNPSMPGQSVTFAAEVIGDFIGVDGSIQFMDGGVNLGAAIPVLNGFGVTLTTSTLSVGTHPITAIYSGDEGDGGSTSPVLNQVVGGAVPAVTTTTLVSSLNPSTFGQSVTFTATVVGGTSPTGSVQFKDGAVNLGAAVALSGTTALLTTSALSVATHPITAVYSGDVNNTGSTSPILNQVVNTAPPAVTATTLASSLNPSTFGQSVTFTATVVGGTNPTGSVQFKDGAVNLGAAVALSGTSAALTTSNLSVATHPITAIYSGDANNTGSASRILNQVVNGAPPAPTTTTLVSSLNPSLFGQSITFTAQVNGTNPTGMVQFNDGATALASAALSGSGVAMFTTSALAVGAHPITAAYAGDAGNAPSVSPVLSQVVNAGGGGPAPVAPTPTLSLWSLIALFGALVLFAVQRVRRARR